MTTSTSVPSATTTNRRDLLTVLENSAIQGITACVGLLVWQLIYTIPRWDVLIRQPAVSAETTVAQATILFLSFSICNLLHSVSFYYTVAHYSGGSTSAGVMKGLQAVLVFVAAHLIYCGSGHPIENSNMCFSIIKFTSLVTVVSGVWLFRLETMSTKTQATNKGYTSVDNVSTGIVEFASENERGKLLEI
jgi:ABC-type nickel/cobalt efflux system permease component RcnA